MQAPITAFGDDDFVSPVSAFSVPAPAMADYAVAYAIIALLLVMCAFSRPDL